MDSRDVRNILTTFQEQVANKLDALRDEVVWSMEYDDACSEMSKVEVVQSYNDWAKQVVKNVMEGMTNER